ncbi:MAG: hypothetical protein ACI8SK_001592 [Shewanella sp.]|jgi:hypothetical protein
MGAGLLLLILSVLATIILVAWALNGQGRKHNRVQISVITLLLLVASWALLLSFGVFNWIGSLGMSLGFIISITVFFIPEIYNRICCK